MRDDRKELNKQLDAVLWIGLGLLTLHLYVELYTFFANYGLSSPISDTIIEKLTANTGLFATPWTLKTLAGLCVAAYGSASRGVKSTTLQTRQVVVAIGIGLLLFVGGTWLLLVQPGTGLIAGLLSRLNVPALSLLYISTTLIGLLHLLKGTQGVNRLLTVRPGSDVFNETNETFPQEERRLENPDSVNLPTQYTYRGKARQGWINITAPYRGTLVMGTPGSGKSWGIINSFIRQHIAKGFSMYVYDYKFPTLSLVAYNALLRQRKKLPPNLRFYCINFDDPRQSHRCNPLHPDYLPSIDYAFQSARTVLLNLNRKWIDKQGEYFVESPINYVTALIWFLRTYEQGQFCTFPHLVELISRNYRELLPILMARPELVSYMAPFASAYQGQAMEQLEGQISSAQIGLARLASPSLYWAMSGNDFMLDINNPKAPKILCLGNNDALEDTYGAALGLYNFRILSLINKQGQHPSSIVVDELPTIYFKGIAKLIATGRSNKIAVTIGMQDYSQLEKDYGKVEAESIKNTCGNVIAGQVTGSTAEAMEKRLGKNVQQKQSLNIQSEDTSQGISTELNFMVPAAKIGQLSQGWVVGVVADNAGQESNRKAFHAKVRIDEADFRNEQTVRELPQFSIFAQHDEAMTTQINANYHQIKADIAELVAAETARLPAKKTP
jgi:hypothetical protein